MVYTSPGGDRFRFKFRKVTEQFKKKTAKYTFPGSNGSYLEDLGVSGSVYPLELIFDGLNHEKEAAEFMAAIIDQKGVGELIHPVYGIKSVVVTGTVKRINDTVKRANVTTVQVTFAETLPQLFAEEVSLISEVDAKKLEWDTYGTINMAPAVVVVDGNALKQLADAYNEGMRKIESTVGKVSAGLNQVKSTIDGVLYDYIQRPLNLLNAVNTLLGEPARIADLVKDKIQAYGDLLDQIINGPPPPNTNAAVFNSVVTDSALVNMASLTAQDSYGSTREAQEAAENIENKFSALQEWKNGQPLPPDQNYETVFKISVAAQSYLISILPDLKQELVIELEEQAAPISFYYDTYGASSDARSFQQFVLDNNIAGDEFFVLPKGREIVAYL